MPYVAQLAVGIAVFIVVGVAAEAAGLPGRWTFAAALLVGSLAGPAIAWLLDRHASRGHY